MSSEHLWPPGELWDQQEGLGGGGESGGGALRMPRNVQLVPLTAGQAAWLLCPAGKQGGPELLPSVPRTSPGLPLRMGERKT